MLVVNVAKMMRFKRKEYSCGCSLILIRSRTIYLHKSSCPSTRCDKMPKLCVSTQMQLDLITVKLSNPLVGFLVREVDPFCRPWLLSGDNYCSWSLSQFFLHCLTPLTPLPISSFFLVQRYDTSFCTCSYLCILILKSVRGDYSLTIAAVILKNTLLLQTTHT